jgi:hypothetical protein
MSKTEFQTRQQKLKASLLVEMHELLEQIDAVYEGVVHLRVYPTGDGYLFDDDTRCLASWDDLVQVPQKLKEFYWTVMGATQLSAIADKLSFIQKEALWDTCKTGCIGETYSYQTWAALSRRELIVPLNEASWKRDHIVPTSLGKKVGEQVKQEVERIWETA